MLQYLESCEGQRLPTLPDVYKRQLQESGLQPEKINLPYLPTPALRQEVWQRLEALGGLVLTSSIPDNIEINAQGADKGSALRALAERLGIPREKVMALGDNGNDVTMLQYAGVSVAMGDGSPEAKAAARFLTAPQMCIRDSLGPGRLGHQRRGHCRRHARGFVPDFHRRGRRLHRRPPENPRGYQAQLHLLR